MKNREIEKRIAKNSIIGSRIRALRNVRGLSIEVAAKNAKISYQGLQAIEKGADPHVSRLSRIATALGVSIVDLLDKDRFNSSLAAAVESDQGQ